MDARRAHLFITITADAACYERVARICQEQGNLSALLASDPAGLSHLLHIDRHWLGDGLSVTGVIVDLTYPIPSASHESRAEGTLGLVSDLAHVMAGLTRIKHHAIIVVSADASIEEALHQFKVPVAACIAPDTDDAQWFAAIAALAHLSDHDLPSPLPAKQDESQERSQRRAPLVPSTSAIQLSPRLWFEPTRVALLRNGREVVLTAREAALLATLLQTPQCFCDTDTLVRRLNRSGALSVDRHSVEQTVSNLRRKLGESGKRSRMLQTRRGLGYGIFPRISGEGDAISPAVARAKGASKT